MKNNYLFGEVTLSFILILLTGLFLRPFQKLWMPTMFMSTILSIFVLAAIIFAGFLWREHSGDEREERHRLTAGRIGFLAGIGFLVVGIIVQTVHYTLDPWLVLTLAGMVVSKLGARLYTEWTN